MAQSVRQATFLEIQRGALDRRLPEYAADWTSSQAEEFLVPVTSDGFRADTMLGDLNKAASVFGSMHQSAA